MDRIRHPVIVRFGENTLRTCKARSIACPVRAGDDILFIDLGAVGTAHEGDAGATFVRGDDPDMHACAQVARVIFDEVEHRWRTEVAALTKMVLRRAASSASASGHRAARASHARSPVPRRSAVPPSRGGSCAAQRLRRSPVSTPIMYQACPAFDMRGRPRPHMSRARGGPACA
ncbi:hypothetical protein WJ62_15920 [Burkholderia diffusa]|nr:hypothetical protein WJ62_15920 [Burkholderia diffusa]